MLGFDAGTLYLNFLTVIEGNIGVGEAARDVGSFLTFNQVRVLGIGTTSHHKANAVSVATVAG